MPCISTYVHHAGPHPPWSPTKGTHFVRQGCPAWYTLRACDHRLSRCHKPLNWPDWAETLFHQPIEPDQADLVHPSRWNKGQSGVLQMDRSVTTPLLNHQDPVFHRHGLHPTANRMVEIYKTPPHWGLLGEIYYIFPYFRERIIISFHIITVMVHCCFVMERYVYLSIKSVGRPVSQSSQL